MNKNKYGDITESGLQKGLDNYLENGQAKVTDHGNGLFLVVFPSGRAYEVDSDGNGTYLGTEEDLLTKVVITADKENNSTPVLVQEVKVSVRTYIPVEDENITLIYAWSKSKDEIPSEEDFVMADLSGTKLNRTATVYSNVTDGGDYYLWVKAIINEVQNPKSFGEYAIKEFTTLRSCASETTSSFLGNSNLKRNVIKIVTLSSSLQGHQSGVGNCWDVSESQKGSILAWYTESVVDDVTYYDVTIAEDGGVVANVNSSWLFSHIGDGLDGEVTITGLENLDTCLTTNMKGMFYGCNNLISLDVSNFNTDKVTTMSNMFNACKSLTSLDVSNFNTANVTSMKYMFYRCSKLTNLDVSKFNTAKVTTMLDMFTDCCNLARLDVSNFNTAKVTSMYGMFWGCNNLSSLDTSNFNTTNVTNMSLMFHSCNNLTSLDVSNFNTENVTTMGGMFAGCIKLDSLDISNFNTENVTNIGSMFSGCSGLTSLDVSNFNTEKVTYMLGIFGRCSGLTTLDLSNFNTGNVTSMSQMFYDCSGLTSLNLSSFNTENVTSMERMFYNCSKLTSLDLSNFNTGNVTSMSRMFYGCSGLTTLNVSNFNTINVTDMQEMFIYCSGLTSIDLRNMDISNVTNYTQIFSNVPSNAVIYVSTEEMKKWVLDKKSSFTNIQVIP